MNESKNLHNTELELSAEAGASTSIDAKQLRDISNPDVQRELLHEQDPVLLKAASDFAAKVYSCPPDPKHPELQPQGARGPARVPPPHPAGP